MVFGLEGAGGGEGEGESEVPGVRAGGNNSSSRVLLEHLLSRQRQVRSSEARGRHRGGHRQERRWTSLRKIPRRPYRGPQVRGSQGECF